ncbi:hypothetical protein P168DRAFT_299948 [Aspergillus campestris IBT 28561]|uniref:Zn(2)-C6 fungal-type domain-containing protein n=1 Tax=Aspergillus campestris (strain IBT 28561) TaxID=1392248 RepID=A0A2I1CSF7_ASPC2|nr:uncharacterized protein P168DRAFT_299948 [Aspergillus campestris IBT 28561]PKY00562.1 hypothetical protein P168DRAFT_299948 [Aspergillus campestris IBT 28561]
MTNTIEPAPSELVQLRRACDRCHSQKLRCERTGAGSCDRCEKMGVTCVFSPSRRMHKTSLPKDGDAKLSASGVNNNFALNENVTLDSPLHWDLTTAQWASQSTDPVGHDFENGLPCLDPGVVISPGNMDFSMLNADEFYMNPRSSLSNQGVSDHTASDNSAPPVATAGRCSPHEEWIRKISDLNIKIYNHAAVFPPAAQHSSYLNDDNTSDHNRTVCIDQTFAITAQVVEALEMVSPQLRGDGVCSGIEPLDQGNLLLVLSLYLRLLDLYYAIFEPLQKTLPCPRYHNSSSCSSNYPPSLLSIDTPSPCPERSWDGRLPRFPALRIGEFSIPVETSVHALMTIQLAELLLRLLSRPEYFMGGEYGLDRLRDSSSMDVAELSLKAAEKRQMEVMVMMKAIKWALASR